VIIQKFSQFNTHLKFGFTISVFSPPFAATPATTGRRARTPDLLELSSVGIVHANRRRRARACVVRGTDSTFGFRAGWTWTKGVNYKISSYEGSNAVTLDMDVCGSTIFDDAGDGLRERRRDETRKGGQNACAVFGVGCVRTIARASCRCMSIACVPSRVVCCFSSAFRWNAS